MQQNIDMNIDGAQPIGSVSVKVFGVGGGGCNAVQRMYKDRIPGIDYVGVNTDMQALEGLDVPTRLRIGDSVARGLGVGGRPQIGRACAEDDRDKLEELLSGTNMVFIAAGMGGGTGTGAAPVIAEVSREMNILTVGCVTKPFAFEGETRKKNAEEGIAELTKYVDTLLVVPNERLFTLKTEKPTMAQAFSAADGILKHGIQTIAELVLVAGEINIDFTDIKTLMESAGPAWMGIGHGEGKNRAFDALNQARTSPLLEVGIESASGLVINFTGGSDMLLPEVQGVIELLREEMHPNADIRFGTVKDPSMENKIKITIIATGFEKVRDEEAMPIFKPLDGTENQAKVGARTTRNSKTSPNTKEGDEQQPKFLDFNLPPFLRQRGASSQRKARAVVPGDYRNRY